MKSEFIEQVNLTQELCDEEVKKGIKKLVRSYAKEEALSIAESLRYEKQLFDCIRGYDILGELLRDVTITEIMINDFHQIFVERNGRIEKMPFGFESKEKLYDVIWRIVAGVNRQVNERNPIVDARLTDGSRVNIVLPPAAITGPIVTIRKFSKTHISLEDMIEKGSLSKELADRFVQFIHKRKTIFISGGTGAGKTTLLNALSEYIPSSQRVITIEDLAELRLYNTPNLVQLEARNENTEGEGAITIRDLIKSALRMRPDRLIIGEVRGSEVIDLLQALNTGHVGSFSTGHANRAVDMLSRLETMFLMGMEMPLAAIRAQIASAIDIIIHVTRTEKGTRIVEEVIEVEGYENEKYQYNVLFKHQTIA